MPSVTRGGGFGTIGTLRNFVNVLREISFDQVRDEAEMIPRLMILAPTVGAARQLGLGLVGPEGELAVTARELMAPVNDLAPFDAVIVFDPERLGTVTRLRDQAATAGLGLPVIRLEANRVDDPSAIERVRAAIVSQAPDRAPAFGRAFPLFRPAAAKAVIDETARANAQFALVSNIPAVIPIVGGLASAGADFLVLTKNQLMMIFKLAAIYGRDLHDQIGIFQEMVPVVGAGFVWRTVAREAASFIPLAAGTVPKVAIAFAGTLAVGRGAELYYRTNRRPTGEQTRLWYAQAAEAVRKLPLPVTIPLPGLPDRVDQPADQPAQPKDGDSATGHLHALPPISPPAPIETPRVGPVAQGDDEPPPTGEEQRPT